jgi:FkbM family methyltransferase
MSSRLRETLVRAMYGALCAPVAAAPAERFRAMVERCALGRLLNELRIDCVIDVGANQGQYARLLRRLRYTGLILSFEPNPDVFRAAQSEFAGDGSWRGYGYALGSSNAELEFNVFENSEVSSFLAAGDRLKSKIIRSTKVPVRRLDDVMPEILPDWKQRRLFLKCDTQGFDLEVVKGAEGVLQAICGLQSEIAVQPLYAGMPRYLEALKYYEGLGFSVFELWQNNTTSDGLALEYDCLMKRGAIRT